MSHITEKENKHGHSESRQRIRRCSAVLAVSASMITVMSVPALAGPVFAAGTWKSVPVSAQIRKSGTAVRKSASESSAKVATVSQGKKYTVSFEKFTSATSSKASSRWLYASSLKGYIRSDLAKVTYAKKSAWTSDALRMRKGAGTKFASSGLLQKGTAVTVRARVKASDGSKWYRITSGGKTVYVTADYITFTNPASGSSKDAGKGTEDARGLPGMERGTDSHRPYPSSIRRPWPQSAGWRQHPYLVWTDLEPGTLPADGGKVMAPGAEEPYRGR